MYFLREVILKKTFESDLSLGLFLCLKNPLKTFMNVDDSAEVTRSALQSSTSIATLIYS